MTLWDLGADAGSALIEAWRLNGTFGTEALTAFAQHPAIVLLYAAPPATERAWVLLRTKPVPGWWLPSLEALVVLWRLLMCAVAVWVVLTPAEMDSLRATLTSNTMIQGKFDVLGEALGSQLWLLLWEILFCLAAFLLLSWLFSGMARLWTRGQDMEKEQKENQRLALSAVARNLLLVPIALIYMAVVIRHILA